MNKIILPSIKLINQGMDGDEVTYICKTKVQELKKLISGFKGNNLSDMTINTLQVDNADWTPLNIKFTDSEFNNLETEYATMLLGSLGFIHLNKEDILQVSENLFDYRYENEIYLKIYKH